MERTLLTFEEIVKIIDKCNSSRVTLLEYGALKIVFDANPIAVQNSPLPDIPVDAVKEEQALNTVAEDAIAEDEIDLREQQLAELRISDPAEFERLYALGELDDRQEDQSW